MMINGQLCDNMDCVPCMMADMDATVAGNGGAVYVAEQTAPERTRFQAPGQGASNHRRGTRTISTRQVAFIKSLLSSRDTRNVTLFPGQTLDPTKLHTMGLPAGTALIDKLLNAPCLSVKVTNQGSDKQRSFLNSLMIQCNMSEADINSSYKTISEAISDLIVKAKQAPKKATTIKSNAVSEGMYKVGSRIFKVQKAKQSDNLYAKELIDGKFEYVAGAITLVRNSGERMTLDEAKAYGKRTGQCCNCGRELTVTASIEAGIGPICAAKF